MDIFCRLLFAVKVLLNLFSDSKKLCRNWLKKIRFFMQLSWFKIDNFSVKVALVQFKQAKAKCLSPRIAYGSCETFVV